jgi:hypothetical protein
MPVAAVDAFFALEQGDDAWQNPDDIDLLCDELANLQIHGAIDNMPARIE